MLLTYQVLTKQVAMLHILNSIRRTSRDGYDDDCYVTVYLYITCECLLVVLCGRSIAFLGKAHYTYHESLVCTVIRVLNITCSTSHVSYRIYLPKHIPMKGTIFFW